MSIFLSGWTILRSEGYPVGARKIILSFDDGPSAVCSAALLDVLAKHQVNAAFCYIGRNVEDYPEIVTRAIKDGHQVVLHSYSHTLKSLMSEDVLREENEKCIQFLEQLCPKEPLALKYFRPPSGIKTPAVTKVVREQFLHDAYVTTFIYDAAAGPKDAAEVMRKLEAKVKARNGGAIVLHEMRYKANGDRYKVDKSWLPDAVDSFIVWAKYEGFEFEVFPE